MCVRVRPTVYATEWETNGIGFGYRCCDPDVNYDSYGIVSERGRPILENVINCDVLVLAVTSSWTFFFHALEKNIWNIFLRYLQDEWINKIRIVNDNCETHFER